MGAMLLDPDLVAEIRRVEEATGRADLFSGFVVRLEANIGRFATAFADCVARGDTTAAAREAHTLKGSCLQLGAMALGKLFADIETSARAGNYAEAQRTFYGSAPLIAQSLDALKRA